MRRYLPAILLGLIAGAGLGLFYAWVVSPPRYVNTAPASLRADYKTDYIQLVAQAYAAEQDVDRARARLAALGEPSPAQAVTVLAQRMSASGGDPETVRALARLASALGARPASPSPPPATPTTAPEAASPTPEPSATLPLTPAPTRAPTRTPTPEPSGVFELAEQTAVCDPKISPPLIQVLTLGADGAPVPGVEVAVEWDGGADRFFTGLKPELGWGYGDFTMAEGRIYTVRLAASPSVAVTGLAAETCVEGARSPYPGSWRLVFQP